MNQTNLTAIWAEASGPQQHWMERVEAELDFADRLCELQPDSAAAWRPLVRQGRAQMLDALRHGKLDALPDAVSAVEALLAPLGAAAKSYTIHCIGHAHIDMNWMWSWPETVAVSVDTFLTVLRLMDEYPDFKLSQSQASIYAAIERHRPDVLEKVAQRVKQHRWEVTASHWVEGDKNMAGGESLCRHLLYTRAYLKQLFGLRPEDVAIDWSPDTFGHAATVPTYLVRGGVKYLYLHRPGVHTVSKPGAFWWEGPDGARVLVRNDMELGYNGQITPALLGPFHKFVKLTGGHDYMFVYGVGDHGGGPTRRDILRAIDMNRWPIFPTLAFSTTRTFYERLEKQAEKLPVLRGEFNTEFTGCYTTQTLIKKANRFAENRLADAELAGTLALLVDRQPYPADLFLEAWRDTLFSQFHDILPGSGVHDTRTYTHGLFQKTMAITSQAETAALRHLAGLVDTSAPGPVRPEPRATPASKIASALGAGVGFHSADGELAASEQSAGQGPRPFVIFNPTARERSAIVEATIWDNAPPGAAPLKSRVFAVRRPDGTAVAAQLVKSAAYWGHDSVTLAFPAQTAGLGYAKYVVTEEPVELPPLIARQIGPVHHCVYAPIERGSEGLENDLLRVELDVATGAIRRLVDKRSGLALIDAAPGAATLEYAVERPHPMSAWSIDHTGPVEIPTVVALRRGLTGPYKASLEVDWRIRQSSGTLVYELRAGDPKLYLHLKALWFQRGIPEDFKPVTTVEPQKGLWYPHGAAEIGVPTLRFAFPLALRDSRGRYEIPFGAVDRALHHGEEVPALQWAQVSGQCAQQAAGCLLLNDCKYGHSLHDATLRLTLIRSSYEPDILPEIGAHEVHVALQPFAGEMPVSEAIAIGQEFNHALPVIGTDVHKGRLPATGRFITLAGESVVLGAIKKTEAGNAMLLRLFNPSAKTATARIGVDPKLLGEVQKVQEVDLLERPLAESTATAANHTVSVKIPAHGLTSVVIKLG